MEFDIICLLKVVFVFVFPVNLWYDMEFDIKYAYYKFLENVANLARNCAQCEPPPVT